MVEAVRVTVGLTAVQLYAASGGGVARLKATNRGTVSVFIGADATVVTTTGYELAAGATVDLVLESGDEVFAISGTAGQVVHLLRT